MRLLSLLLVVFVLVGCESPAHQREKRIETLNKKILELELEASKQRQEALNLEIEMQKYRLVDSSKYTEYLEESKKKEIMVRNLDKQLEALKKDRDVLMKPAIP